MADSDIDLAGVALALAAFDHPGLSLDRYQHHLKKIASDVGMALKDTHSAEDSLKALTSVLADTHGYEGDQDTYDHLDNADLIRVIDRRKGLPVALAILYIRAGRANGLTMDGLAFPGHFLCRLEQGGTRLIFDPFHRGQVMEAPDLRILLKKIHGPNAELSADYYRPCSNRDILIRLHNNTKLRLIEAESYAPALACVERMRLIDPKEYRLLFDAGVLQARLGHKKAAIETLESYLQRASLWAERRDAEVILRQLKTEMH
jgi:regulator of sirC expression with transglutaminase-like and TPR domain